MPLYSLLLVLVLGVGAPFWLARLLTSGRYRAGLAQRLGRVPPELRIRTAGSRDTVWLHAVSVGEVLAAAALIEELHRARPGWPIAISTTTEAGQRLAQQRFPAYPVFYMPLDLAVLVRRYLRALRPRLLILMESEFWPNLLRECRRAGVAVVVANARVSDRSYPRYLRLRRLWQPILRPVALFLAQGRETARRLEAIGVGPERIEVTGNLKYDLKPPVPGAVVERIRAALAPEAVVLIAGSTLEDEETVLLDAWPRVCAAVPGAVLLLAPRRTERFDTVAEKVRRRGFAVERASAMEPAARLPSGGVLVLDTIGDLAAVYALGAAAFVGGSLVQAGGHNPLEAARFGVPVIMGASFENFREIVAHLQAREAIRIVDGPAALAESLIDLLRGGEPIRAMGRRGAEIFAAQEGAARRSVEALLRVVDANEGSAA